MKVSKFNATLAVVFTCLVAVGGTRSLLGRDISWDSALGGNPRAIGRPDAEVRVIEYSDYLCGACQKATFLLEDYFELYPSRISIESKRYYLRNHPYGLKSAVYAECAARQNKFWNFHHLLFKTVHQWARIKEVDRRFYELAKAANLDIQQLDACLQRQEVRDEIERSKAVAFSAGVRSTPTFFINGKMVVGGFALTKELDKYFPHEERTSRKK